MKPAAIREKHLNQIDRLPDPSPKPDCKNMLSRPVVLLCAALVALTLAVYFQTGNHQFLGFDDNVYVTANPHVAGGLTGSSVRWAFTSIDQCNWHPITWLSHLADVQFYGMNPRGHHLGNVALHTASSLLLLLLLFRLTGALWQSGFVAALFALHPLHVESVAWVAERKDVLSAFFFFLTLLLYAQFTEKRKPAQYILCLFFFVLGLMSKPMLVTLPMVLLLLDYWPLERYRQAGEELSRAQRLGIALTLVREKIPFFCCSILSAVMTIYAQHKGGATSSLEAIPFMLRIENALLAYLKYALKTLWPVDLAVLYPFSRSLPLWQAVASLIVLSIVTAAVIKLRGRLPFLVVGWSWFLITLVPVIGLIQVGNQAMADRYSYIPVIGLFIMAAWGVPVLASRLRHRTVVLSLLAGAVVAACAALTWHQLGYWQDSISLYRHTLQVTADNYVITSNLGIELAEKGDVDAAIQAHRESIRINPDFPSAHYNLGFDLDKKGETDAAIQEYRLAIMLNPQNAPALNNLGADLSAKGDLDGAIQNYREALQLTPDDAKAHCNLGRAFTKKGNLDDAMQEFRTALGISPNDAQTHLSLGLALAAKGDPEAAIQQYRTAIGIDPNDLEAHNNLGVALVNKGDLNQAIREFQDILRLSPNDIDAHSNLGVALAKTGNLDAAIGEFQSVLRINPKDAYALNNLGRVLAQKKTGR
jgi:protein O-mannosyl-transferase